MLFLSVAFERSARIGVHLGGILSLRESPKWDANKKMSASIAIVVSSKRVKYQLWVTCLERNLAQCILLQP